MILLIVSVIIVGIFFWILLLKSQYNSKIKHKEIEAEQQRVACLSVDTARNLAIAALRDPKKYHTTPSDSAIELHYLPPTLQELFRIYQHIESVRGETVIDQTFIKPWEIDARFTIVGNDVMHTVLLVCGIDDTLYELDGSEDPGLAPVSRTLG